jgi:hypothetical protein
MFDFKVKPEKIIEEVVGLGVPGITLLILITISPYAGGAAIVWALSTLGPGGMIGGIISLPVLYYFGRWSAKNGTEQTVKLIAKEAKKQGLDKEEIIENIQNKKVMPKWVKEKVIEQITKTF